MTNAKPAPSLPLWIGSYTGGGGGGLYPLSQGLGDASEGWSIDTPYADAPNAAFGTYSSRFDVHYLVDEQDDGAIGIHRHVAAEYGVGAGTNAGHWTCIGRVSSGGAAPCHIALDHSQSCLAVANYTSGSVALYMLDPSTGLPLAPPILHALSGSGPNPERQQSPHAHWVGFSLDNRWLYATDLGADAVLAFAFDPDHGTLDAPVTAFAAAPGSGPRHLLLHANHPQTAYLACELSNQLVILDVDGPMLRERRTLSTLPAGWQGETIVAHIGADAAGDRLYVSNRGHDSIAVFALDADGDATLVQHAASGGASPRFFLASEDGRQMIVAHERDHRVTMHAIRPDGTLASTGGVVIVPGAAFVMKTRPNDRIS